MVVIFSLIMMIGVAYLLLMIFSSIGDAFNVDSALESTGLDTLFGLDSPNVGEVSGLGCSAIAAFLAGFGAVGLTGTLAGWNLIVIVAISIGFGYVLGRGVVALLGYVHSQQSTSVFASHDLLGMPARVTIDSPAGKTGEVLIEGEQILKYPVKEVNGAALKRGDIVEVIDIDGRFLQVKKKRGV
jgi:membrane protein implicated in regulation of membrane protease activity